MEREVFWGVYLLFGDEYITNVLFIDINKALFDYRYRKQTQHHHHNNNNKFFNAGGVHHQKNQMRSVPHHQQQNNLNHVVGNTQIGGPVPGANFALNGAVLPTPATTPLVSQQQKGVHHQQQQQQQHFQHPKALLQHPQPQVFQQHQQVAGSQPFVRSVVAASPDSFVEELVSTKFDPFVHATNLSSSVSSGGGSTVSYGSNDDYLSNNNNNNSNNNIYVNGFNDFTKNGHKNIVNNDFDFNDNNNSVKCVLGNNNHGWSKIWGNDMSVWG